MVVVGCWNRYLQYDGVGEVSVLYDTHLMSKDEVGDRIKRGGIATKMYQKYQKKGGMLGKGVCVLKSGAVTPFRTISV